MEAVNDRVSPLICCRALDSTFVHTSSPYWLLKTPDSWVVPEVEPLQNFNVNFLDRVQFRLNELSRNFNSFYFSFHYVVKHATSNLVEELISGSSIHAGVEGHNRVIAGLQRQFDYCFYSVLAYSISAHIYHLQKPIVCKNFLKSISEFIAKFISS